VPRDENPYAPPADRGAAEDRRPRGDDGAPLHFQPASRGARLVGALVDRLVSGVIVAGALAATADLGGIFTTEQQPLGLGYFAATVAVLALQAALIARSGQSVGKLLMRTRIVLADGRTAGLVHGFLLRSAPLVVIALIPDVLLATSAGRNTVALATALAGFVSLADALSIFFGTGNRCLHDHIAGTYVAGAGSLVDAYADVIGAPRARPRRGKKMRKTTGTAPLE
jgi:uncharacterized RDD family membrane protein YckC